MIWAAIRVRPFDWKELRDLSQSKGYTFDRHRGDHYVMTAPGAARPVVIPMKRELKEDIVLGVARTIGMSRSDLEEYIRHSKRGKRK